MKVPIVAAGGAALMAENDLDQVVVQAAMIWPEPLNQFGNI
ncbi:hypothetical protein [Mesorhizobium captivum]|nr:hypothetical protein [Mesorhizobium sp. VK22B]